MSRAESLQTPASRFKLGKSAALLFDQIIFNAPNRFRCSENTLPVGHSLSEQNFVAFVCVRRPVFTMDGANPSRVGSDPGDRIGSGFHASSHIQLQHDRWLGFFGEQIHGALTDGTSKLRLMVVVSGG